MLLFACGMHRAAAATCTVSAVTMNFGTYISTTNLNSTSTVSVTCPSGAAYAVSLNAGTSNGGTILSRRVTQAGGWETGYSLFRDSSRTLNWGQTVGTDTVAGTGSGAAQPITVYGQIGSGEYNKPGTYTDTITATVSGASITTVTATFTVTVLTQAACTVSATNLSFGVYTGALNNTSSTLSVVCTDTTTYNVGLNAGNGTGATVTNRKMTGPGSAVLLYSLFQDSAYSVNWGNTVGTDTVSGTDASSFAVPIVLTVYGQLAAAQFVTPGSYSDVILVTLTY